MYRSTVSCPVTGSIRPLNLKLDLILRLYHGTEMTDDDSGRVGGQTAIQFRPIGLTDVAMPRLAKCHGCS